MESLEIGRYYFLGCALIVGIILLLGLTIAVIETATGTILADWLEFLHLPSGKVKKRGGDE